MRRQNFFIFLLLFLACTSQDQQPLANQKNINLKSPGPTLDREQAQRLAALPLKCLDQEFPYKLGQTLGSPDDLATPIELHPAFYGCFDWHSAVHGHWSLVALLKQFPDLENAALIRQKLLTHISEENIRKEIEYFSNTHNRNFERTYGWAWLLKLATELKSWDDAAAGPLLTNLQPLANLLVTKYSDYLPKLLYPIRSGTHPNTAFGLSFAFDYAQTMGIDSLSNLITTRCRDYYLSDNNCPLAWEPSGADFLSPCLEEIDIMRRILPVKEFKNWLVQFRSDIFDSAFHIAPGLVADREDGQLVHLDGVNFSRAWCLYPLANMYPELVHLRSLADLHVEKSLENITDGHYEGGHWLASFAILALQNREPLLGHEPLE